MKFKDIKIGAKFKHNGTIYVKSSSRTARILENNRVFYFNKNEYLY